MHWKTLKKILEHSGPPGYRQSQPRRRKKLGPYEESIRQILKEDKAMPKKQRHTAKRIFERLQKEGYVGGCKRRSKSAAGAGRKVRHLGGEGRRFTVGGQAGRRQVAVVRRLERSGSR